jgi:hypothetical protein
LSEAVFIDGIDVARADALRVGWIVAIVCEISLAGVESVETAGGAYPKDAITIFVYRKQPV